MISIIALLISILLPVLGSARDTARQSVCLSNQRQLGCGHVDVSQRLPPDLPSAGAGLGWAAVFLARRRRRRSSSGLMRCGSTRVDYYLSLAVVKTAAAADRNYVNYKQDPVWDTFPASAKQNNRTFKMNENFRVDKTGHGQRSSVHPRNDPRQPVGCGAHPGWPRLRSDRQPHPHRLVGRGPLRRQRGGRRPPSQRPGPTCSSQIFTRRTSIRPSTTRWRSRAGLPRRRASRN